MIIQPDFIDHWKTRLLVEITGDPSAPLSVIRGWGFCQTAKRSFFPDMTPAQLASICYWGNRKPVCNVALIKCGFVEKLSPKGFAFHEWSDYNAKLLANWENGKLGGRPKKANESNETEKPVGSVGITQTKPIEQTRTDRLEQIDKKGVEQMDSTGLKRLGSGSFSFDTGSSSGSGSVQDLASALTGKLTAGCYPEGGAPTLRVVENYMETICRGGGKFADKWLQAMIKRNWLDAKNQPVRHWRPLAQSWATGCVRKDLGVTTPKSHKGGNL